MNIPVFDLHCDTALALVEKEDGTLLRNKGHIDLTRAKTLAGYAQCFACFTTSWKHLPKGVTVTDVFEREMNAILAGVAQNEDLIAFAGTAREVEENRKQGKMSAILTIEGAAGFGFDPSLLETLYRAGFRISTLTWNERNPLAGSHVTGGGLTDLGREYVKEAQRLGMIVDVSHISDEAFWDIMDVTEKPIIASHSNSRAVWDCSRNLTDEMFTAICRTGGVAGLNQFAWFLGKDADLDTACDHIFHFLELDPTGKHIALGGDLDGCDRLPVGFEGVQDYPKLADRLAQRGLDEKTLLDIFWNNALGVMERCCM